MNEVNDSTKISSQNEEYKILAKNSIYSGLFNFSLVVYSMLYSFFVARLLSIDLWGVLILATSLNYIITQITRVFPPSIERTLSYYVPKFYVLHQESNLKAFIRISVLLKLIILVPVYFLSILVFQFLLDGFYIDSNLIVLLSPLIIFDGLNLMLNNINLGFNKANTNFILYLIRISFSLIGLLICLLFIDYVSVELIALITVVSYLIPFSINCIINLLRYLKLQTTDEDVLSFKEIVKVSVSYGSPLLFNYFLEGFWLELQKIGVGTFSTEENVTGFNAAASYSNISKALMNSLTNALVVSFSRMHATDSNRNYDFFYNLLLKYSLFIVCLTSGLLFLLTDFSLVLIYGIEYLQFSIFLKLLLIATPFKILVIPFDANILGRDKTKILTPIKLFAIVAHLVFFFTFLIYFDVVGAIFGIILGEIVVFAFYTILHYKVVKIKISLKKFLIQFSIFFMSLIITVVMEGTWMNNIYQNMLLNLNLTILKYFPLFSLLTFVLIFLCLNFLFKIIIKEDMENFESFFKEKGVLNTILRRGLKFIKRIAFF